MPTIDQLIRGEWTIPPVGDLGDQFAVRRTFASVPTGAAPALAYVGFLVLAMADDVGVW